MIFIKLHQGETKEDLHVQVSHIVAISGSDANEFDHACLVLVNGMLQVVNETPDEIIKLLRHHETN